jgi:cyclopropane fatty-acyl-phospholipid synthase-like methyltransferase
MPIAHRHPALAVLASLVLLEGVAAQSERSPEQYAESLERPERVARMQVERVVRTLGLRAGDRVADIGAGSGLFSRAMARAVGPTGLVYAVDIQPGLLEIIEARARAEGLEQVRPVQAERDHPNVPEPVDLVFMSDALHHLPDPPGYLTRLRTVVKPGGRIAVIDFLDSWPGGHEELRYTPEDLDRWMTVAGFAREASHDFIEGNFFIVYR